jgi:metallo-beta-lactamase class B
VLEPFPSARVDGLVVAGQAVRLGSLALMPLATPGHTAGALTWQWQSCEGVDCRTLVYTDSLSPVSNERYKFGHNPDYLAAYRASLARVAALDCDVLLTPHPSASGLYARAGAGLPADPAGCRRYGDSLAERLEGRLAQERAR